MIGAYARRERLVCGSEEEDEEPLPPANEGEMAPYACADHMDAIHAMLSRDYGEYYGNWDSCRQLMQAICLEAGSTFSDTEIEQFAAEVPDNINAPRGDVSDPVVAVGVVRCLLGDGDVDETVIDPSVGEIGVSGARLQPAYRNSPFSEQTRDGQSPVQGRHVMRRAR